jgi:hypothetical protein
MQSAKNRASGIPRPGQIKPMKTYQKLLLAVTMGMALPSLSHAEMLVMTKENNWTVSRNVNIVSDAVASGGASSFVNGSIAVSKYTGVLDLSRVIIKVLQPTSPADPVITSSLSGAGTSVFSSSTANNQISENSTATGPASLNSALTAAVGFPTSLTTYNSTKTSGSWAGQTMTSPATINESLNITEGPVILFDSSVYGGLLTSGELNSIFRDGASSFSFNFTITSFLNFARDSGSSSLTAALAGINTGTIIFEYYSVPEPSTAALMLIAGGAFMMIRRRKATTL